MAIYATNTAKKRELIPPGNYIARCYSMIEIGTVTEVINGIRKQLKKVRIEWELPGELRVFNEEKGPEPLVIGKEYTLSLNEKSNLRRMLASWRGKDFTNEEAERFDITALIGIACMLNIINKAKKSDPTQVYADISSISAMPKGVRPLAPVLKPFVLSYDKWDEEKFNSLPDFIKQEMKGSLEYKALKDLKPDPEAESEPATMSDPDTDNELPF